MEIAIIGGGMAGAACALHLLRDHPALHAGLTIIEPRPTLGAGLAYSTPAPEHRINVAAARMSLLPEDPLHFDAWLRARGIPSEDPASAMPDGRLYPARAQFGRYVAESLQAQVEAHPGVRFRHVRACAQGVTPAGQGWDIRLEGGDTLQADAAVLAVSHSAPDLPAMFASVPGVVPDPWDVAALGAIAPQARILIVGTGLTACDVVASLIARGHHGSITAVSRHGLLPRPRTLLPVEAEGDFTTDPEPTARLLLRRVRRAVAVAASGGRPWENIIDALRQQAGAAWGTLDWAEKRRLLRHLRTYWDVHRFQCAPQIDATLQAAQASGALRVVAGFLRSVSEVETGIQVRLRPRGAAPGEESALEVDAVINCTGPGHRSVTASHPVLRGLAAAGGLIPDPAALGIWVDATGRVLRQNGEAWPNLFVAGPLARGTYGELMGLPQVNLQPRAIAAALAGLCVGCNR
jgi:uncharacterized NAD(P)/FAD-binding protein YdhS